MYEFEQNIGILLKKLQRYNYRLYDYWKHLLIKVNYLQCL